MHQPGNSQHVEEKQNYERLNLSHLLHIKRYISEWNWFNNQNNDFHTDSSILQENETRGWNPASSSVSQYAMYAHNDNANIHY